MENLIARMYNNENGHIFATLFDGAEIINVQQGFEDSDWCLMELVEMLLPECRDDEYDPEDFSGNSLKEVYEEIINACEVIAELYTCNEKYQQYKLTTFPQNMGSAAWRLFRVPYETAMVSIDKIDMYIS